MEYALCERQYTGKSETTFSMIENYHQRDIHKSNMS